MKKLLIFVGIVIMQTNAKDKQFIKDVLYKDATYLQNRLTPFNYMTNPEHIWDWTWNKLPITEPCKLLEVGTGFGTYWERNLKKIPTECDITLTDLSAGMLKACKEFVNPGPEYTISYQVADVEALPFADNSFDIVFAHFLLCYTNSPEDALRELKRVVKPGGIISIFTLHLGSRKELHEFAHQIDKRFPSKDVMLSSFCDKNADKFLKNVFSNYRKYIYSTDIIIPSNASMTKVLHSIGTTYQIPITKKMEKLYQNKIDEHIKQHGQLHTSSQASLFICQKEK